MIPLATAWRSWGRVLGRAIAIALSLLFAPAVHAAEESLERLQVMDPYIELRTGPGRGFPIFFVVERNEWIEIELRHTDWFKVRTAGGKEGWVDRMQLENTLTEAGSRKSFRDILLDDYLRRRLEFGGAVGHFDSDPMLKLWASYNIADTLALEVTAGEVQGFIRARPSGTSTCWQSRGPTDAWDRFSASGLEGSITFPIQALSVQLRPTRTWQTRCSGCAIT